MRLEAAPKLGRRHRQRARPSFSVQIRPQPLVELLGVHGAAGAEESGEKLARPLAPEGPAGDLDPFAGHPEAAQADEAQRRSAGRRTAADDLRGGSGIDDDEVLLARRRLHHLGQDVATEGQVIDHPVQAARHVAQIGLRRLRHEAGAPGGELGQEIPGPHQDPAHQQHGAEQIRGCRHLGASVAGEPVLVDAVAEGADGVAQVVNQQPAHLEEEEAVRSGESGERVAVALAQPRRNGRGGLDGSTRSGPRRRGSGGGRAIRLSPSTRAPARTMWTPPAFTLQRTPPSGRPSSSTPAGSGPSSTRADNCSESVSSKSIQRKPSEGRPGGSLALPEDMLGLARHVEPHRPRRWSDSDDPRHSVPASIPPDKQSS